MLQLHPGDRCLERWQFRLVVIALGSLKLANSTVPAISGTCYHCRLVTCPLPHSHPILSSSADVPGFPRHLGVPPSFLCLKLVASCPSFYRTLEHLKMGASPDPPRCPQSSWSAPHPEFSPCTAHCLAAYHFHHTGASALWPPDQRQQPHLGTCQKCKS